VEPLWVWRCCTKVTVSGLAVAITSIAISGAGKNSGLFKVWREICKNSGA